MGWQEGVARSPDQEGAEGGIFSGNKIVKAPSGPEPTDGGCQDGELTLLN